ncbi:intein C-terminal splicing region/intein N-terminal splicing region/RHS repeat-associated core domain-containing protein [Lentzea waywayandensis]|uniref:Intein C-terminal splicing region/intein N-terminal splicing region/RHS repeat-associated core domain-containing protein n=1 Tax=Lentzea waywayandensis TaxID=84724 RepID=A0A1I6F9Y3_9PSEU|nr:RHS repeat-associated core domain-containing protein [Lentzea waywayandensis]SFR26774.1 intein C-terminal splicing region/intein N-terminal splicing region/RHS repeat-associated core domain-containing protein [Lentzea waywayandensis]
MKLKRALIRGLAVCLALTAVTATVQQQAIAAPGPSVNAPDVSSVATSNGSLSSRGPDEATSRALQGNQPAASNTPGGGSFGATPFSASASWEVSKQSGDFSWSYPLRVPPAPGGFVPSLGLSYRSSAVDGLTSATNNQPSWIGDGWDLSAGFVERAYGPCATDTEGGTTPPKTGDLCWRSDNATASFGSKGGMLIKDDQTGAWRMKQDDRSRIERVTTAGNGDRFNESWKITTVDGTQYFFGSRVDSKSTWTVPVFGDDAGEPCHESTFEASSCDRAWRWMLDKAVDPRGNVILYNYETETNKYGKNLKDAAVSYVRAGTMKSIEYGLRDDVAAPATGRVEFGLADRCVKDSECTFAKKENWPDAAVTDNCDAATCKDKYSPSFWSTKRLSTITSQVRNGTGYQNVDRWTLQHEFPKTDDVYQAALWLKSIQHTGLVGGEAPLPEVSFEGAKIPNRVDTPTGIGPLNRYRVTGVVSEAGGVTQVKYAAPDCVPGQSMPANPETNGLRCYPVKWAPPLGAEREDYFHKYVVESVTTSDRVAASAEQIVRYEYLDGAAWRRNQSEFTKDDKRTWNEFRGYGRVRVRTGHDGDAAGPVTMTEDRFYRGMHGDKLPNNGTRTAKVTDSEGVEREDSDWLSGIGFESQVHDGTSETVISKSIANPVWAGPTASRGDYKSYWVARESTTNYVALRSGGWRKTKNSVKYDDHGQLTEANDLGDLGTDADDQCARTSYVQDEPRWRWTSVAESETVAVRCDVPATFPGQALNAVKNTYDGVGNLTKAELLGQRPATGPVWTTATTATYDVYGRTLTASDALGNVTKTDYVPATGGPVTGLVTTNALGHTVTSTIAPAWGTQVKMVDPNENVTEAALDALGRTTHVWLANRPRGDYPDEPTQSIEYGVNRDAPSSVTTKQLAANGNYLTSAVVYDGQYRLRQTQTPTDGGRLIVDTRYDSQGRTSRVTQPFFNNQAVDKNLLTFSETDVPGLNRTEFDGAGRDQNTIFQAGGQEKWRTIKAYGGDRVDVTPPKGGTPTTKVLDAQGRTTELWQYKGLTASGDHDTTRYAYSAAGKLTSSTDPAGNTWRWEYDLRGREVRTEDVDRGVTTMTYDELNRIKTSTDALQNTLTYDYDPLGRATTVKSGATLLKEYKYDTAGYGVGLPASSTRYVDGNAYTNRVNAYSSLNKPLSVQTEIPDVEGPLKGTYKSSFVYRPDGSLFSEMLNSLTNADMPTETVSHSYDDFGRQVKTFGGLSGQGTDTLVNNTSYTRLGELYRLELGSGTKRAWLSYYYDDNTRRLNRYIVDAEVAQPKQADVSYGQDDAGNVQSITDTTVLGVDKQCFGYDHLRRLTQAWTVSGNCGDPANAALSGATQYAHSYEYDQTGNRTKEIQRAATGGDTTRTYEYAGAHNLKSVTTQGPGGSRLDQFTYDAVGNTKSRNLAGAVQNLDWDVENKVAKLTEGAKETKYVYTTEGTRLLRRDPDGTTLYVGMQELRLAKGATKAVATRYYSQGGQTVAMREGKTKITWLASDHQGTSQIAVDRATMAVTKRRQLPFGGPRGSAAFPGERGFVGGTNDPSTGLVNIGARQYDSAVGRFLSVDPIMDPADPQQWNAYVYSNNSPITFSDPSGLWCDSCNEGAGWPTEHGDYEVTKNPNGDVVIDQSNLPKNTKYSRDYWSRYVDAEGRPNKGAEKYFNPVQVAKLGGYRGCFDENCAFGRGVLVTAACDYLTKGRIAILCAAAGGAAAAATSASLKGDDPWAAALDGAIESGWSAAMDPGIPSKIIPKSAAKAVKCENSFTGDTLVLMADGTTKRIDEVEVGDEVAASEPESSKTGEYTVLAVFVTDADKKYTDLTVATPLGPKVIHATANHPFYDATSGEWEDASELSPGDLLQTPGNGRTALEKSRTYEATMRTYNLTVEGVHTYHVLAGGTPVLVHNCPSDGPGAGSSNAGNGGTSSRDIHGNLRSSQRQVDVDHVWNNGELYIQNDGQLVKVLENGDGTYSAVVRDPSNMSGAPTTVLDRLTQSSLDKRIDEGRWQ